MMMKIHALAFCSDVLGYKHFRVSCFLHLQDEVNGARNWTLM